ncbi:adenylate/guanylate cyclase domain-containing protein, partial [Kitasatospora sp. DSM 101779]|nr:adenylate/guanylate cyclase domain-containing protein [Kitasatospora sp. DSM 101779]
LALAVLDPGPGLRRAADAARAALPLFEAAGDDLGTARACLRLAQERQLAGRHGEAEQLLRRALDGAVRADAEPERAAALGAVGVSLWTGPVPVPEAVERCRTLLARHGAGRRTVRLTLNCPLAVLFALQERWAQARACLAEAERLARELAFAEAEVFLPVFRAAVHSAADRPGRAVEELRQAERACRGLGAAGLRGPIARDLARALLDCGDTAAAEDVLTGHQDGLPPADAADLHGTLARVAALRGRPDECAEQLRRTRTAAGETDSPVVRATAALDEARAALALGDPARASAAADAAADLYAAKGHVAGRRRAAAVAAVAARAERAAAARTTAARTTAAGTAAAGTTQEDQR